MTMSSFNSSWSRVEHSLNRDIEELNSTFERMLRPRPISAAAVVPASAPGTISAAANDTVNQPSSSSSSGNMDNSMDMTSRMRATKVFNVMLVRLWRRRSAEVYDLHELTRSCQAKANIMRNDLHTHNKMMLNEQRRCNRLEMELRQAKYAADLSSETCSRLENTLSVTRRKEAQLRRDLQNKTLECDSFAELLNITRTEMFRELTKFRQCAQELAAQQRLNCMLEECNAELEDKLLTLKDRFQTQHDEIALAFHLKQEKIDEAYETLKGFEQELAELELKYIELLKESHNNAILQKIVEMKQKTGIVRYAYYYVNPLRWRISCRWLSNQVFSQIMAVILSSPISVPDLPTSSMGVYLALVLLISVIY